MSADPRDATIAFNRFGLGARPGGRTAVAADPRGALRQELTSPPSATTDLPGSAEALAQLFDDQKRVDAERARAASPGGVPSSGAPGPPAAIPMEKPKPAGPSLEQRLYRDEALWRWRLQTAAPIGFLERLVAFWSNHFSVSVDKDQYVRVAAGPFEREAIRPHVLGRFADMLEAVAHHPAMIHYLDNQQSIGPDSPAGRKSRRGLNENLAREILELHTLGVGGGYTQADVTSFAGVLTGWTAEGRDGRRAPPGSWYFRDEAHQPGEHSVFGIRPVPGGEAEGRAVLDALAVHPATARHLATKLVRHFVADDPPPALVDRLAAVWSASGGDLAAVSSALIDDELAWTTPPSKVRRPSEFLAAIWRATDAPPQDAGPVLAALAGLGETLWQPTSPAGFSDHDAAWATPVAMKTRLDVAWNAAGRLPATFDPEVLLDTVAGPSASAATREAVGRAESRRQAAAIVFASPEFQRR